MDILTSPGRADMRLRAEKERHQESRENVGYFALAERQLLLSEGTDENDSIEIEPEWLHEPPPTWWTPVVGSQSQEVSDGRTSTTVVYGRLQTAGS
jgi:hypothetical protein